MASNSLKCPDMGAVGRLAPRKSGRHQPAQNECRKGTKRIAETGHPQKVHWVMLSICRECTQHDFRATGKYRRRHETADEQSPQGQGIAHGSEQRGHLFGQCLLVGNGASRQCETGRPPGMIVEHGTDTCFAHL